jgi:mannosyltransferase
MIKLDYEIGSGKAVEIPPRRLGVIGQTQDGEPGKKKEGVREDSIISSMVASALLLLIGFGGTVLRFHLLTKRDLWVDEAASVFLARLPWGNLCQTLWSYQANMSLYFFLLRGWLHLGDSEATVRSLSVLFGVAVIPAVYLLGKHLFGRKAAIASASLSAVNIFQIRYSQEARAYSLVMLVVVLSTYFWVRAVESPTRKRYWVGYVLTSALGIYVHLFVYLVIAAQWLSLGYARSRPLPRKALVSAAAGFLLVTTPMNAFILLQHRGLLDWIPHPTTRLVVDFAKFFTGNGGVALFGAYAALCLVALLWAALSESRTSSHERWFVKLVAWWLFFPIASTLLFSVLVKPVFYDRYMGISAPALALLAGQGMAKLDQVSFRLRGFFPVVLLVMVGLSVLGVHRYDNSSASGGDNWRLAIRYLLAEQQPGDAVFLYRSTGDFPFEYYAHREMEDHGVAASPVVIFPVDVSHPPQDPDEKQAHLVIQGRERIWLILQHYDGLPERRAAMQAIQVALQNDYRISQERVFSGISGPIRILLYVRDSSATPIPVVENGLGAPVWEKFVTLTHWMAELPLRPRSA